MLSTEQPDTDVGTLQPYKTWQPTKVQQMNFTFFEVDEISVKKKKNLTQLRGMENLRRMSPKYRNSRTASKGQHMEIIPRTAKKELTDNIAD